MTCGGGRSPALYGAKERVTQLQAITGQRIFIRGGKAIIADHAG